ncbi:hypothetical protein BGX28_005623 [Mortierella sp. GBA30]|nr:hypothetical protein BGX28_005623 [Mortierella sp. GBA30]
MPSLTEDDLRVLQQEVDCLMNFLMTENYDIMKDFGGVIEPISCGYIDPPATQMYILSRRSYSNIRDLVTEDPDSVVPVLFEKMPTLARYFLPAETDEHPLCLFNEQYIVKTPKSDSTSRFAWHEDSQYMDSSAQQAFPIISCWTALDAVNQSNGTLLIEPFPRPIDRTSGKYLDLPSSLDNRDIYLKYHMDLASCYEKELDRNEALAQALDPHTRSSQGWSGTGKSTDTGRSLEDLDNPTEWTCERQNPILVDIPAGSIVFLSGFVRHCSLGNSSSKFRRAYMPQYSSGEVVGDEERIISLAVPVQSSH